ncbi:hypothetical protein [Sabulicella glaciei]|uniref:SMODS and SLOG-associating 2TM effector domain-containing protein n=1 Tax=Sabulicella glaciei TaxID=2984948 RepID=A0ABT3P1L3_9PROT|nr:hypothetical protein [Roseococcus sp. MDT2-1-1]MCW8088308.1 hypothetical protein [Roseococcus sp. MDT2-1-1]
MSDAPALPASVSGDPEYRHVHERREEAAAAARGAQEKYRRLIRGFIASTAFAAVAGGLVLYGADATTPAEAAQSSTLKALAGSPPVHVALRTVQALAVAVAAFCAYALNTQDHARVWREEREKAEAGRCERARVALRVGHGQGPAEFRAAGDWAVADLVEGQIRYLGKAVEAHDATSSRLTLLAGLVLAAAAAGPVLAAAGLPALVLVGGLAAVVTPALLAGFKSWGEATGSAERARLHRATRDLLRDILRRRREFDRAIDANDLADALLYVDEICAALRTDVEGFLRIARGAPVPPASAAGGTPADRAGRS